MVYIILLLMTYLGAQASVFLKKASGKKDIKATLLSADFYIGSGLYLAAAVLNIYILRFLEYSKVLPLTSVTYVWTMVLSYLIFKEKISKAKLLGVILILAGSLMIAYK